MQQLTGSGGEETPPHHNMIGIKGKVEVPLMTEKPPVIFYSPVMNEDSSHGRSSMFNLRGSITLERGAAGRQAAVEEEEGRGAERSFGYTLSV
jgi:hypothetical protein